MDSVSLSWRVKAFCHNGYPVNVSCPSFMCLRTLERHGLKLLTMLAAKATMSGECMHNRPLSVMM